MGMLNMYMLAMGPKSNKETERPRATGKKLTEQDTYDMYIFLSIYCPSVKSFRKEIAGRSTGRSSSLPLESGRHQ